MFGLTCEGIRGWVLVYCRDTVWRGVIRKAGSRAGKFKDHEEGRISICTNKILLGPKQK